MPDTSFAKARTWGQLSKWVFVFAFVACSKKPPSGTTDAGPDAGSGGFAIGTGKAPLEKACQPSGKGASFTLGTEAERNEGSDADGGVEEELPFSVSLGNAVVKEGAFLITATEQRGKETHAVLAQIAGTVDRGRVLDLGRVYGDAEPPRLGLLTERAVVAVPDADAGGRVMKVGLVSTAGNSVEWLENVAQGSDDSPVFSLATQGDSMLLAWDELEAKSRRGFVRWKLIDTVERSKEPAKGKSAATVKTVEAFRSPTELDAEAPQLVTRPGGYWLGFLAAEESKPVTAAKKPLGKSSGSHSDASEDGVVVELGRRKLLLLSLDRQGAVAGSSIAVTEPGAHVETFALETMPEGGVLVTYREARRAPGVEADEAFVVEVKPDGSVTRLRVEDERIGAGLPLLLVAKEPKDQASVWLGIAGKAGDMNVAVYFPGSGKLGSLIAQPALLGSEPVARDGRALLTARPRGRVVEFERVECDFDEKSPEQVK